MSPPRRWIIGRIPGCDIVVPVQEVSSRHCELVRTNDGFTLADLGSLNGNVVNGKRIDRQLCPVSPNDKTTLGVKTPFVWPADATPAAPRPLPRSSGGTRVLTIGCLPTNDIVDDLRPSCQGHGHRPSGGDRRPRLMNGLD